MLQWDAILKPVIKDRKMPRPKPPSPLIGRQIRLTDKQFLILGQLGGAEWLRTLLEKKAPFPAQYYEKIFGKTDATNHD
jgi:hypothetical protein